MTVNNSTSAYESGYVWAAQESFQLQLEALEQQPLTAVAQRTYLRNMLLALDRQFAHRNPAQEQPGGALQELRDAAELLLHDSKAPVALPYLKLLIDDCFAELAQKFITN